MSEQAATVGDSAVNAKCAILPGREEGGKYKFVESSVSPDLRQSFFFFSVRCSATREFRQDREPDASRRSEVIGYLCPRKSEKLLEQVESSFHRRVTNRLSGELSACLAAGFPATRNPCNLLRALLERLRGEKTKKFFAELKEVRTGAEFPR